MRACIMLAIWNITSLNPRNNGNSILDETVTINGNLTMGNDRVPLASIVTFEYTHTHNNIANIQTNYI